MSTDDVNLDEDFDEEIPFNEEDDKLPLEDDELGDDEFGPAEEDDDFEDDFSFGDDE